VKLALVSLSSRPGQHEAEECSLDNHPVMTSGTSTASSAPSTKTSPSSTEPLRHQPVRSPSDRHSSLPKSKSPSPDGVKKARSPAGRRSNGDSRPGPANGGNLSDAETDILSSDEHGRSKGKKRTVKRENGDRGGASSPSLANRSEPSRSSAVSRSSSVNDDATDKKERRTNGVEKRENGHAKPAAIKKTRLSTDAGSATSRAQSADASLSPQDGNGRARQAQSAEPRKRKFSDAHRPSKLEPPRQRPRLDDAGKPTSKLHSKTRTHSPTTPATPGIRAHKRSASTQSTMVTVSSSVPSRKRREASSTTVASDRKEWNSESSSSDEDEEDSSPRHPPIPKLEPPPRRSSKRDLTSPARAMAHSKRADKYGTTPLARACERGNMEQVRTAWEEAPSELNQADHGGYTPLQKAALEGHAEVVQFLLDKGCRTDCFSTVERDTPLIDAVENGHLDVVKILLKGGVKPHHQNKRGNRAIDAIDDDKDYASEMKELIQNAMTDYIDDDDDNHEPINLAQEDTKREDLLYLEPNRKNLLEYSRKGDTVAVDHFLSSVKPDNACAVAAARGGHDDVLNLLLASAGDRLEKDPDPAEKETPLIAAIGRGNLKVIRLLLDQDNFNPTRKTRDGKTYYELAEEMRGPRWQTEVDLLKDRYDEYMVRRKAGGAKKKKMQEGNKISAEGSRVSKVPVSPKAIKHKRLMTKKELPTKDQKRRSRPVLDSSQSEGSDDEVKIKKPMRKRKESSAGSKDSLPSPVGSRQTSGNRPRSATDSKVGKDTNKVSSSKRSAKMAESSDVEMEDTKPVKEETPEAVREDRRAAEAAKAAAKAAEKAAEEQARIEEAERLKREAEELAAQEAARKAEEAARKAEEERLRLEKEKREREERLDSLPTALKVAVEKGSNRPLHFGIATKDRPEEMGIRTQFLPLHLVTLRDIDPDCEGSRSEEQWMMSFQAVGILGLPSEMHLTEFPDWEKRPVTDHQRELFLRFYDLSQLAQEYRWPQAGEAGYDHASVVSGLEETRRKFVALQPMDWIRYSDFTETLSKSEYKHLASLKMRTSTCCRITEDEGQGGFDDALFEEPKPATPAVEQGKEPDKPNE
jgi:ankyrin repeat protein